MSHTRQIPAPFADVPFVDHHSHSWLRGWQQQTVGEFRACFTESPSTGIVNDHVIHSVPYMRALHILAALIDSRDSEEAILEERRSLAPREYLGRLFGAANIDLLLLDDGFPPPDHSLRLEEIASLTGARVSRVLRIESLVETLMTGGKSFAPAVQAFDEVVGDIEAAGAVGLKTIAAYRSGLRLTPVSWAEAAAAWTVARSRMAAASSARIETKHLIDFFVLRALEHASGQQAPFQIHAGFGDPDLDLRDANPLHLKWVLEDSRFAGARLVILHGAYPFTREAAYLASVYPNVYLDISAALPPLGTSEIEAALRQAVDIAPVSKLLLSSDAARIPEHHALGAYVARQALYSALKSVEDRGDLAGSEVRECADWLLWRTARSVYPVGGA